jgi:hypothetical protein
MNFLGQPLKIKTHKNFDIEYNYNISTPILKPQIINDLRGKNGKLLRNSKQKLK